MNTLQTNFLQTFFYEWKALKEGLLKLNQSYPLEVEGIHGSLSAFFIAEKIRMEKK